MIRTGGAACRIRTPSWVPLLDQTLRALKERKAPTVILAPGLRSAPPAFAGAGKAWTTRRRSCGRPDFTGGRSCGRPDFAGAVVLLRSEFCRKARRKGAHRP